jgi:hypothetical protein
MAAAMLQVTVFVWHQFNEYDYSHVMMVVKNDTINLLYCAHTNDRLNASFANFGASSFDFYAAN